MCKLSFFISISRKGNGMAKELHWFLYYEAVKSETGSVFTLWADEKRFVSLYIEPAHIFIWQSAQREFVNFNYSIF